MALSSLEHYGTLLRQRRYRELVEALDRDEDAARSDVATWRVCLQLRAILACRGVAPPSDLLRGAVELLGGEQLPGEGSRAELLALGVVRLAAAGARAAARRLLDGALERHPSAPALVAASRQLRRGPKAVVAPLLLGVDAALRSGDRLGARREIRRLLNDETSADTHLQLLELSAALDREELAFAAAAEGLSRLHAAAPKADAGWQLELKAALDWWAAGEASHARQVLAELRGRGAQAGRGAQSRFLGRLAAEVLRDLERRADEPAGPRWSLFDDVALQRSTGRPLLDGGAGGALRLAAWALGLEDVGNDAEGVDSMARLRRQLNARGVVHQRLFLDEERILSALSHGAFVLLEEERPSSTGYLWLRGYDPEGRLLLLADPAWAGPLLRPLASQHRRSELFGFAALVVWGSDGLGQQRLARAAGDGLVHDERLDLLDSCELDDEGRVPPRVRVARVAQKGMQLMPELQRFSLLRGESLLGQLRAGELNSEAAGAFERWFAGAHHRFPEAEWPYQIYARALESQGRSVEAGMAWAEAERRDPADERNAAGHGRALLALGRPRQARDALRRAATLAPGSATVQAELAAAALACDASEEAELESQLALDLDAANPQVLLARVDVLEARGAGEAVIPLLGRASALSREDLGPARRLLRHQLGVGAWADARRLARGTLRAHTARLEAWNDAAWCAYCAADAERCHALALDGLQRVGAEESLVLWLGRALVELCDGERRVALLDETVEQLTRRAPQAIKPLALMLADAGHGRLAASAAERARGAFGEDVNGWWHLAQVLLHCGPEAERELARALMATVEMAPPFAYARIVEAHRALARGDAERALRALEEAALEQAPGLIWWLTGEALEALGRHDKARSVRERLPEVFPRGVLDHVAFLRELGMGEVARSLLRTMLDHWRGSPLGDAEQERATRAELGLAEAASGDPRAALEAFMAVAEEDVRSLPLPAAVEIAVRAKRWQTADALATAGLSLARRDSQRELDPWPLEGYHAGARLVLGDVSPRRQLLPRLGRHPGALAALVEVQARAGDVLEEDSRLLMELAPGSAARLARRPLEPSEGSGR